MTEGLGHGETMPGIWCLGVRWPAAVAVALLFLALTSVPASLNGQTGEIRSGDRLRIELRGQEVEELVVDVDGSGYITLPEAGILEARGLTPRDLAPRIAALLRLYRGDLDVQVFMASAGDAPTELAGREVGAPARQPTPPGGGAGAATPTRRLAPGDSVRVHLPDAAHLDRWVVVADNGTLLLPGIGLVQAAGATLQELSQSVAERRAQRPQLPLLELDVPQWSAPAVVAEEAGGRGAETLPGSGSNRSFSLLATGGMSDPESQHLFGGVLVHFDLGRFGLFAQGQVGQGGAYTSVLGAGGLTAQLVTAGPLSFSLLASGGLYRESVEIGLTRSVPVAAAGLLVTLPVGPLTVGTAPQFHLGRYEGDDRPRPIDMRMIRVPLVVGWGGGR